MIECKINKDSQSEDETFLHIKHSYGNNLAKIVALFFIRQA